jgi:hypothetical protein
MNPVETIEKVSRWGWEYHLNEVALSDPPIMFDAPGDFQLMLRQDLFDIDGFDENMLLGWHVDSNIAKRLSIVHGNVQDLSGKFFGYHCDHTRQVTPAHQKSAPANDLAFFVYGLTNQFVENQRSNWGFNSSELEVFSLANSSHRRYEECLQALALSPQVGLTFSRYADEGTSKSVISPQHRAPFIADLFSSLPRHTSMYWVGALDQNFEIFREISIKLNFHKEMQVLKVEDASGRDVSELLDGLVEPDESVFICNFTGLDGHQSLVAQAMSYLLGLKCDHHPHCPNPARFVGIGASNGFFESFWDSKMISAKTPFSLGFKHGVAERATGTKLESLATRGPFDLLSGSIPGVAGIRSASGTIEAIPGVPGPVSFGPFDWPPFGSYEIEVVLSNTLRGISNLNWEGVKTISKKLRSRGRIMGYLLPFGAAFAKLMWWLRLGPFGTIYVEVCYGSGKSFKAFPSRQKDGSLLLRRRINFSSSSKDSEDFLGLEVRVVTAGHYEFEVQRIRLSKPF